MERIAKVERNTKETSVKVRLDLDGKGVNSISTGVGFLDHMLELFAVHGLFDLEVEAKGDLHVDCHHTVEDVAIVLGRAIDEALGTREGIVRIAHSFVPMDEALARVAVDLGGRGYAVFQAEWLGSRLGTMDVDMVRHFFDTLALNGRMNLHAAVLYGQNDHHKAEALFKALARALSAASRFDKRREGVPSSKGVI
jgi:imidazoleglycerol-phosphate dehydratase